MNLFLSISMHTMWFPRRVKEKGQMRKKEDIEGKGHFHFLIWPFPHSRSKNLRPLLNRNIPLISGKFGLRNHFWPLKSGFLTRKSEKKSPNFLGPWLPISRLTFFELSCNFRPDPCGCFSVVAIYPFLNLACKIFYQKIRSCKFFDKFVNYINIVNSLQAF